MKSIIKSLAGRITRLSLEFENITKKYHQEIDLLCHHNFSQDRTQQIIISNQWKESFCTSKRTLKLQEVAFKIFSGNGQDGILLYLLTILGVKHHTIIDIGCGNGISGNSANLIINHGFDALLIDGDQDSTERGVDFYSKLGLLYNNPPSFVNTFLNKRNVDSIISNWLLKRKVDVLSIDIDSIDLYILNAISCTLPRIVVLEFNNAWSPTDSKSVPYSDEFSREWIGGLLYGGASLAAFNKILKAKGYWLIGCDPSGFDAYFLREGESIFPEASVQDCYEQSTVWQNTHAKLSQSQLSQKSWTDI
ncbi:MAG: hypothetical protein AAGN15_03385 [Cyanobacteria bacterium J06581_3]